MLIVEGHFILRHPSEDGTYIPQVLSACGWQHVYNKTWAKPLLYISITDQLYRHVTLITLFCRSAVPQHQAPVSLQCVSAVVFTGIKKKIKLTVCQGKASLICFSALLGYYFHGQRITEEQKECAVSVFFLLRVLLQHLWLCLLPKYLVKRET